MAVAAPVATAQTGSSGGGMVFVAKPVIAKVSCLRRCASRKRAQAGSTLKIVGESLGSVRTVLFQGSYGKGDDVEVKVRPGSDTRVLARVPIGAVSGPISVATGDDV